MAGGTYAWWNFNSFTISRFLFSQTPDKQASGSGHNWGTLERLVLGMSQRHYLLSPSWVQFSSVAQSCPTLCDPMNRSMPGLPVHHQLPEFTQTHVHWVGDAIQPSHPLSSPSPPARNPSQHQGLFQWVNSLHEVAKVLEFSLISFKFHHDCRILMKMHIQLSFPITKMSFHFWI